MTPYEEYDAESIKNFKKFKKEQRAIRREEKAKAKEKRRKVLELYAFINKWKEENKDPANYKRAFKQENIIFRKRADTREAEQTDFKEKSLKDFVHTPKIVDKDT